MALPAAVPETPVLPPAVPESAVVTKLADKRGQVTLKAHAITDEWERLVKSAARRNGQSVADFVVTLTTAEAQRILKGEPAVTAALPARPEDSVDRLAERLAAEIARRDGEQAMAVEQRMRDVADQLASVQAKALEKLGRNARWWRWAR